MEISVVDLSTVVMTLTVFFTEAFKRYLGNKITEDNAKFWSPFSAIIIGALLNLVLVLLLEVNNYAQFWQNFQWQQVLREGLDIGMRAGGLYGMGKVVVTKVKQYKNNEDNLTPP